MREPIRAKIAAFFFRGDTDRWLTVLRIGVGIELLLYCFSLRADWTHLFASNGAGLISRDLTEAILSGEGAWIPRMGWLVALGEILHIPEEPIFWAVWFALLASALCLTAGLCSRTSALTGWFLHLCAVKSIRLMSYGVDSFLTTGLFYLIFAPLPDRMSLDRRWRNLPGKAPWWQTFSRRVLQLHLCLMYFFSGLTKMLGAGWWDGTNLWRALTRAPFDQLPAEWIAAFGYFLPAAGILICFIEVGYPFFIWPRRTRLLWLTLVLAMHAGIAIAMGLYLFALIMIILNLAAFWPDFLQRTKTGSLAGLRPVQDST